MIKKLPYSAVATRRLRDAVNADVLNPETVKAALAHRADPNVVSPLGRTALCTVSARGCISSLDALLLAHADPFLLNASGESALHEAVACVGPSTPAIVSRLLLKGLSPMARTHEKEATVLHCFLMFQHHQGPGLLSEKSSEVPLTSNETFDETSKETHWLDRCITEVFEMLVSHGADVCARDKEGCQPAHHWAKLPGPSIRKLLTLWTQRGGDPATQNSQGLSVVDLARQHADEPDAWRALALFLQATSHERTVKEPWRLTLPPSGRLLFTAPSRYYYATPHATNK